MNGINLHMVVRSAITAINPDEQVILYQSAPGKKISAALLHRFFLALQL